MFEQATLTNGPAGKRVWATFLGMTSQVAVISMAVLAPMVWPQVLPLTRLEITLTPPLPPGPQRLDNRVQSRPGHTTVMRTISPMIPYEPVRVPDKVTILDEQPAEANFIPGALPGSGSGSKDGVIGSVLDTLLAGARPPVVPHIEAAPPKPAPVESAPPVRYRQGGLVHLGKVLHRAEPAYPQIAKIAHAQGNVELECVVGADGRISEVKVRGGNPLLIKAAVDAAWQWVYEPSKLNGVPIEIVTIMTFTFKLN